MFPRLEYLEWMQGRPAIALYDLGSSDLRGDRDHGPAVVPAPLEDRPDPPVGATVELQLAERYGVEPEQVLVTPGATSANLLAEAATVHLAAQSAAAEDRDEDTDEDAADEPTRILVEKPGYEPLVKTPLGLGSAVDRFLRDEDDRLDPDRVEAALTPNTELVIVTNRHNPSGALSDRETLEAVASVVRAADARLLVDEVYAPFVDSATAEGGDGMPRAFGGVTAADLDDVVVTSSFTKFFGLGDLSIGWLVGDETLVEVARSLERHIAGVAGPSRALAARALHNADDLGAESRALLLENAELLADFVARRDDVEGTVHPGSTFAFLDVAGVDGDEVAAAAWEDGILVVPGRFFEDEERIRVSLGRDPDTTAAGLDAFGALLDDLVEGDARRTEP